MKLSGNIIDVFARKIFPGTIEVAEGKITAITGDNAKYDNYILPGFVDAHIHVESSMLIPSEFARVAVVHGTVASVSDPHEIGNVLGIKGVRYMIENGKKVPFKFYFGAPSCVPATSFETAGADITPSDIRELFEKDGLVYLSEMMNYPGVLFKDPVVMEKLKIAKELGKPVDGHAPGLTGDDVKNYIEAGISTDHECFTIQEALGKIKYGMKILIREGSAAKNFEALKSLVSTNTESVMFCSDDKHPDDLLVSHINDLVKRSLMLGYDLFDILECACVNAVNHYKLDVGLLRVSDPADFIVIDNPADFNILQTYINGVKVAEKGKPLIEKASAEIINNFNITPKSVNDFRVETKSDIIRVIIANEGQLITDEEKMKVKKVNGNVVSDIYNDVLKLAVIERYETGRMAMGFIKNFGLKKGAIASSVAHDCHNIIAIGTSDEDLCNAVNAIINAKGGVAVAHDGKTDILALPVAGIMSNEDAKTVSEKYSKLDKLAKSLGCTLKAPFMTLSFMALLVIPQLKLSDKGLFDCKTFKFTTLEA